MGVGPFGGSVWLLSSVRANPSRWWCPFFLRAIVYSYTISQSETKNGKKKNFVIRVFSLLFISSLFFIFFFGPTIWMSRNSFWTLLRRGDLSNNISTDWERAPWCWKYERSLNIYKSEWECLFLKPECSATVVFSSGVHRYRKHSPCRSAGQQVGEEEEEDEQEK